MTELVSGALELHDFVGTRAIGSAMEVFELKHIPCLPERPCSQGTSATTRTSPSLTNTSLHIVHDDM